MIGRSQAPRDESGIDAHSKLTTITVGQFLMIKMGQFFMSVDRQVHPPCSGLWAECSLRQCELMRTR